MGSPHKKDHGNHGILGSILGSPSNGKLHVAFMTANKAIKPVLEESVVSTAGKAVQA